MQHIQLIDLMPNRIYILDTTMQDIKTVMPVKFGARKCQTRFHTVSSARVSSIAKTSHVFS